MMTKSTNMRGFTLIELMVAVGLFAIVMTLASGSYLVMMGLNRQAQGISTGINNLSFALESMTRDIRTGYQYNCGTSNGHDCSDPGARFYFINRNGQDVDYNVVDGSLVKTVDSTASTLTDSSVTITDLKFYVSGSRNPLNPPDDHIQPRVTIIVVGKVSVGPGKPDQEFTVQTGATMLGSDI